MLKMTYGPNETVIKEFELFRNKKKRRGSHLIITNKRLIVVSFYKKKSDELYGVIDYPLEAINGPIITNTSKHLPIWWWILLCFPWTTIIALILLFSVKRTYKGTIVIPCVLSQNYEVNGGAPVFKKNTIVIPCVTLGEDFKQIQSELGSIITEYKSHK